jgi:ribosomal protein L20
MSPGWTSGPDRERQRGGRLHAGLWSRLAAALRGSIWGGAGRRRCGEHFSTFMNANETAGVRLLRSVEIHLPIHDVRHITALVEKLHNLLA